ncbi:MAG: nucleotidyltransferase domain-containing protein [Candidatus Riflebacteria bacterium]|jgi:predicted nucleotidyltransferase|nr:nucleotidyltransferase domain-containing protein [Candidatus Riflebacteria bacterium]
MTGKMKKRVEKAAALLKSAGCKEVYLFGSVAEGNDNEDSDIDIAIKGCPQGRFFELLGRLMLELDCEVDLVNLDHEDAFSKHLLNKGQLLHVA